MPRKEKTTGHNVKNFSYQFNPDDEPMDAVVMKLWNETFRPNKIPFKSFVLGLIRGNAADMLKVLGINNQTSTDTPDTPTNIPGIPKDIQKHPQTQSSSEAPKTLGLSGKSFGG